MSEVGDDVAMNLEVVAGVDLDPLVSLDLGQRCLRDVVDIDGSIPLARLRGTGQHEQRLRVATHSGHDVVDLVETCQLVRVALIAFEVRQPLQQSIDQTLVAAPEVDEHVRHDSARSSLLGCE